MPTKYQSFRIDTHRFLWDGEKLLVPLDYGEPPGSLSLVHDAKEWEPLEKQVTYEGVIYKECLPLSRFKLVTPVGSAPCGPVPESPDDVIYIVNVTSKGIEVRTTKTLKCSGVRADEDNIYACTKEIQVEANVKTTLPWCAEAVGSLPGMHVQVIGKEPLVPPTKDDPVGDPDAYVVHKSRRLILTPEMLASVPTPEPKQDPKPEQDPKPKPETIEETKAKMAATPARIIHRTVVNITSPTTEGTREIITQPVFFRVHELGKLVIHPEVTENISLPLEAYKSSVRSFRLQVEGVVFREIGRQAGGVIFAVTGRSLPGTQTEGTYYILNENHELVTTGPYTMER